MKHIQTPGDGRVYDEATHQWVEPAAMSKSKAKRVAAQKPAEAVPVAEPRAAEAAAATPQPTKE